ncbi:hypothetical protein ACFLXQ_02475 [Chloroflexota bacterium]
MEAYKTRDNLRRKIIEVFAAQEEVYQIRLFGKEVEGKHDCYSDIDLIVCSNDPAKIQARYMDVFGLISPVRATFTLGVTSDGFSEMVMLKDYSPYQKIDFSIGDLGKEDWPFVVVYENKEKPSVKQTTLNEVHLRQDVVYKLTDILFSIARFTKCLFRRDVEMYRRWKSITDATLVMLYEKYFGWESETFKKKLDPSEAKCLYENLEVDEKEQTHIIFPPNAKLDLALSYQTSIGMFIELAEQKADYFGTALDFGFIEYIKRFMNSEIDRYRQHNF